MRDGKSQVGSERSEDKIQRVKVGSYKHGSMVRCKMQEAGSRITKKRRTSDIESLIGV